MIPLLAVVEVTDYWDGHYARKYNEVSDFGKLFDPLADKLMVVTALVCQAIAGVFPWVAIAVVACKEAVMMAGGMFMLSRGVVVYSNYVGKTAQVFFIASLLLSFFHPSLEASAFRVLGMTPDLLLLWITVALSLAALVVYAAGALKTLREKKPQA